MCNVSCLAWPHFRRWHVSGFAITELTEEAHSSGGHARGSCRPFAEPCQLLATCEEQAVDAARLQVKQAEQASNLPQASRSPEA